MLLVGNSNGTQNIKEKVWSVLLYILPKKNQH